MQRFAIRFLVGLLAFEIGLITSVLSDYFYIVPPSALILLILAKKIRRMNLTFHHVKVAVITSILSSIVIYIFLVYCMPRSPFDDCVMEFPHDTHRFAR